jgi:hypothetical protein
MNEILTRGSLIAAEAFSLRAYLSSKVTFLHA